MTDYSTLTRVETDRLRQWEACREWFLSLPEPAQKLATACPPIGRYYWRAHGPEGGFYIIDSYAGNSMKADRFLPDGTFLHTVMGVTPDDLVLYDPHRSWDDDCRMPSPLEHQMHMEAGRRMVKASKAGLN